MADRAEPYANPGFESQGALVAAASLEEVMSASVQIFDVTPATMAHVTTPLAVLDLVPISSGSTATEAVRNSIDLAQRAEELGYARYWFAEHHLNPGVAGTSPAVLLALTAAETSTIRLGSGALQMGHRTALSSVEEFGLLDALASRPIRPRPRPVGWQTRRAELTRAEWPKIADGRGRARAQRTADPARFNSAAMLKSPRIALQKALLQLPGAQPQNYTEQVGDILALIADTYRSANGEQAHVVPGEGAELQVWILGSSGGESAVVAGKNGLAVRSQLPRRPGRACSRPSTGTAPRSRRQRSWIGPT